MYLAKKIQTYFGGGGAVLLLTDLFPIVPGEGVVIDRPA
jgi:hypothetical protein